MAPSSTSLPASPLPFGADTHTHSAWRRSLSVSRTPQPNAEAVKELYKDTDRKYIQDYPGFVAAARASDLALHRTSASIPPSSINDLPHRIRKVLKRHKVQLWVLAALFQVGIILLTIAITLGATTAHSQGDGSTKAAAIILGLIGLLGAISSAAFGWLTWQGRQARARLEKQWVAEEEVKEKRSLNEKATEEMVLKGIRDRERSLSLTRGRSRGSLRGQTSRIPSFRELTLSETGDDSPKVEAPPKAENDVRDKGGPTSTNGKDRDSGWTHHLDLDEDEDEYVPPVPPVRLPPQFSSLQRAPNDYGNGGLPAELPAEETSERGVPPNIQQREHKHRTHPSHSTSRQLGENTTNTRDSLSPTLNGTSPINEETAVPFINSLLAHRRALSAGNHPTTSLDQRPILSPRSLTPTLLNSPPPNPSLQDLASRNQSTPALNSTRINSLLANRRSHSLTTTPQIPPLDATPPTSRSESPSPPPIIPRAGNAHLGSAQSDANFLAMLDDEDARSEDEAIRYLRTERSREQVGRWAASLVDLPWAAGLGEGLGMGVFEGEEGRGFRSGRRRGGSEDRGGRVGRGRVVHIASLLRRREGGGGRGGAF